MKEAIIPGLNGDLRIEWDLVTVYIGYNGGVEFAAPPIEIDAGEQLAEVIEVLEQAR